MRGGPAGRHARCTAVICMRVVLLFLSVFAAGCLVQPPPGVVCTGLPDAVSFELVRGPVAYKGLVFDDDGGLIGSDTRALLRSGFREEPRVVLPGVGEITQLERLPSGDVVTNVVETGDLIRVTPGGGIETLVAGLNAYAVRVGPGGALYTAGIDGIFRVDADTLERTAVVRGDPQGGTGPRVLSFERSGTRLYYGGDEAAAGGVVRYVEIDVDGSVTSGPHVLAEEVGGGFHDAMAVDACGNVYVLDWWWSALLRVTPGGDVDVLLDVANQDDGPLHGLRWGSGDGGWDTHHLYAPRPATREVFAIELGLPAWHHQLAEG